MYWFITRKKYVRISVADAERIIDLSIASLIVRRYGVRRCAYCGGKAQNCSPEYIEHAPGCWGVRRMDQIVDIFRMAIEGKVLGRDGAEAIVRLTPDKSVTKWSVLSRLLAFLGCRRVE